TARDETAKRLDDRRAPGDRAGAQIIAVREAARQDHAVEIAQLALAMPDVAHGLVQHFRDHVVEVAVAPRTGQHDDAESHSALIVACGSARGHAVRRFDPVVPQVRFRATLPTHLAHARAGPSWPGRFPPDVDRLPDAQAIDLAEAEPGNRALPRRALH